MFPTYVLTPDIEDHCYRWANRFDLSKHRHPGNEYERAMGRFGECCVSTYMKAQGLNVRPGPDFGVDLIWITDTDNIGIECKTKVQRLKPRATFNVTVDSENYAKQSSKAALYVFTFVYPEGPDTLCSVVGFELSSVIANWEWLDKGDTYPESGHVLRYPTYRHQIDGIKPVNVLKHYGHARV